MPRRRRRPPIRVTLVLPAEPPTQEEMDTILMAADAVIGQAGRSGVTLILNGSRSKKALEWEWDKLPDDLVITAADSQSPTILGTSQPFNVAAVVSGENASACR